MSYQQEAQGRPLAFLSNDARELAALTPNPEEDALDKSLLTQLQGLPLYQALGRARPKGWGALQRRMLDRARWFQKMQMAAFPLGLATSAPRRIPFLDFVNQELRYYTTEGERDLDALVIHGSTLYSENPSDLDVIVVLKNTPYSRSGQSFLETRASTFSSWLPTCRAPRTSLPPKSGARSSGLQPYARKALPQFAVVVPDSKDVLETNIFPYAGTASERLLNGVRIWPGASPADTLPIPESLSVHTARKLIEEVISLDSLSKKLKRLIHLYSILLLLRPEDPALNATFRALVESIEYPNAQILSEAIEQAQHTLQAWPEEKTGSS